MRPLIMEFIERPVAEDLDFSLIEYDSNLNLNVDRSTGLPAIDQLQFGTSTHTRIGEVSDSDPSRIGDMLATETFTKVNNEGCDSDPSVGLLMATKTITTSHQENSDWDPTVPPEIPKGH